jgi:hypothetical protein
MPMIVHRFALPDAPCGIAKVYLRKHEIEEYRCSRHHQHSTTVGLRTAMVYNYRGISPFGL